MRIMWRAWALTATFAASLVLTNGMLPAADLPVVHVKAVVKDGAVRLEAQANGPFEYTTYRPSASLFVLDLTGVSAADPAGARVVSSDLVKSYRELSYDAGKKPVVRLEILLSDGVEPRLERNGSQDLTVLVSRTSDPAASAPAMKPAADRSVESTRPTTTTSESIQQVSLTQADGQTEVSVLGSGHLTYHASRLQNPDRLVLDFAGSHLKTTTKQIASNLDPVREIRLAQFSPKVSRVVIDLRTPSRYDINAVGNTVTVAFAPKAVSSGAAKSDPVEQPSSLTTTTATAPIPALAPAQIAVSAPAEIPAPSATLPAALTQPSSALAAPATQQEAVAAKEVASQAVTVANNSPAPSPVSEMPAMPAASVQPVAMNTSRTALPQSPASTPAPSNRYSGEPISVNLKDVDLRDFFRLIHEISGLNVVMDPSVKGTLTIVLDDVPWDQALDIVLKNNDLDKQLDGNVLRIATKDTVKKEAEETRDLAKAQAEAADVVTSTRVLNYAKADEMASTLKKFLSSRGDILADTRSNTLVIRDVPSTFPVIDNLLRQLDRKSQQVEIEARVVAANRSFSRELGSQLAAAGIGGHNILGGNPGAGTSPITHTPAPPLIVGSGGTTTTSGAMPLLTNLATGAPTSGISYIFQSTNFALDYLISAAEERGVGKLLSEPKETVQNNQKAVIKQGTKIPVQTIVNNTVSVQFVDAVLELDVTPQITSEGTIYMDVTVENDQIDASIPRVQGIPAIDTQSAASRVTVKDGETMLLGGIIVTSQRTDIQSVPLIGSVPILGNLFKHTTVSSTSQELLFFITPRILPE
jgi:type IV pilus assembly protein PilQ